MDQAELLNFVAGAFEKHGIKYAITGSHASIAYGEIRFTNDIDVIAQLDAHNLTGFVAQFPSIDFYVSEDAAHYAVTHGGQFNIIHPSSGLKVDVIVPHDSNWPDQFVRSKLLAVDANRRIWFISPEDLILKKMDFYREGGSEKHLRDIAGILKISRGIDQSYISGWSSKLGLDVIWKEIVSHRFF